MPCAHCPGRAIGARRVAGREPDEELRRARGGLGELRDGGRQDSAFVANPADGRGSCGCERRCANQRSKRLTDQTRGCESMVGSPRARILMKLGGSRRQWPSEGNDKPGAWTKLVGRAMLRYFDRNGRVLRVD